MEIPESLKHLCFFFLLTSMTAITALASDSSSSSKRAPPRSQGVKDVEFERIYQACITQTNKDQICQMIIATKTVGEDAIETIKELIPMGPYEYAILTSANFAATGRLRVRTPSLITHWEGMIDYDRDGSVLFTVKKIF